MKKLSFTLSLLTIACLLIMLACQKDDVPYTLTITPENTVTASVQGRVTDQDGLPVSDAIVKGGTTTTTTDINGVFHLDNTTLSEQFGYITVDKAGFFQGSRTIVTEEGAINYVQIELMSKELKGSFTASSGGTISIDGSTSVVFMAGSVMRLSDSTAYDGDVEVYATYLDPTADGVGGRMPGDLRGVRTDSSVAMLQSFGMMVVELETPGGEQLQVARGQKAIITMTVPASLQATAPASIPLWYFDKNTGRWREEGKADKSGNVYTGTVEHFSFWNCDVPINFIYFNAFLKDQNGNGIPNTKVVIEAETGYGIRQGSGYTDATGYVRGAVPKGVPLTIKVYNRCGALIYQDPIGSYTTDKDLGDITITMPDPGSLSLTITGTAINCDGGALQTGEVQVLLDGLYYRAAVTDGSFSISIDRCTAETADAELTVADYTTEMIGEPTILSVTNGTVNAGQLQACDKAFSKVIGYTMDGISYYMNNETDSINVSISDSHLSLISSPRNTGVSYATFLLWCPDAGPGDTGTFPSSALTLIPGDTTFVNTSGSLTCILTEYDQQKRSITGTFSGTVTDSVQVLGSARNIEGYFKIKY